MPQKNGLQRKPFFSYAKVALWVTGFRAAATIPVPCFLPRALGERPYGLPLFLFPNSYSLLPAFQHTRLPPLRQAGWGNCCNSRIDCYKNRNKNLKYFKKPLDFITKLR